MSEQVCKNCGNNFIGKYCNICGEKVYTKKEKNLGHIVGEGLHFITHFEGKFFNTLKVIFLKPGKLSLDYCNGIRIKYFKPLSFFLMLVILYLLFPVFEGLNMDLHYHKVHFMYGDFATREVAGILNHESITEAQLAETFHRAGEKTSKFLLFIIIPCTALFSFLIRWKERKPYYDHFVFTIEACSFFILWSYLLLPLLDIISKKTIGYGLISETISGIVILAVFIPFVGFAAKRFFDFNGWFSILYAFLFTLSLVVVIECIYKFILFLIAIRLV